MRGIVRAAKESPEMIMSTEPSVRPWFRSDSLPSVDAGKTSMWYLPLVRFSISPAAHTDHLWNGSEVSYTCAHLSLVWATAAPEITMSAASAASLPIDRMFTSPPLEKDFPMSLRGDELHLGALRLVLGERKRFYRFRQRKLAGKQRADVDAPRGDVLDRPVELDAPAECPLEVELLGHDVVHHEGKRFVRQRAHLHDRAAALDRRDAGIQRRQASGSLERDVELRR